MNILYVGGLHLNLTVSEDITVICMMCRTRRLKTGFAKEHFVFQYCPWFQCDKNTPEICVMVIGNGPAILIQNLDIA